MPFKRIFMTGKCRWVWSGKPRINGATWDPLTRHVTHTTKHTSNPRHPTPQVFFVNNVDMMVRTEMHLINYYRFSLRYMKRMWCSILQSIQEMDPSSKQSRKLGMMIHGWQLEQKNEILEENLPPTANKPVEHVNDMIRPVTQIYHNCPPTKLASMNCPPPR